ncbi:MAG: carbohydrate ABC transporter permease [Spirochaetales bacterium]|nr:carbohydrate ABC transporter permease [Spirochaetales bacterium]
MNNYRGRHRTGWVSGLIVFGVGAWVLLPLLWMVVTSLKVPGTELRLPLEYFPQNPTLENFATILGPRFSFLRAVRNSLVVSSVAMVITLALSTAAAFALTRLRFRYRVGSLLVLQIGGMVPPITVVGPTFVLMRSMGLLQTPWAMILPNAVYGLPLAVFLLATFMGSLPIELDDAARIDGAGSWRIFTSIILPLSRPALTSAGILVFMGSWGEFMLANSVSLGSAAVQTLPVSILGFSRAFQLQWTWVSAGVVLSLVPIFLLSFVFQRYIVQGLTAGSLH